MNPGRLAALTAAAATGLLILCAGAVTSCGSIAALPTGCTHPGGRTATPSGCTPPGLPDWDIEQVTNAEVIVQVGTGMRVPVWGQVIAVATAMQESRLRNLPHGDRDSLGLFQQRPSQGWGTPAQLLNPHYAAEAFYQALLTLDNWQAMPLTQAAQAVQRSALPGAYARWAEQAAALVATLGFTRGRGWVQPVHARVVSGFRSPQRPRHNGVDLAAARHTIIVAAAAGTVATVACNAHHLDGRPWGCHRDGNPNRTTGCGWYLNLQHAAGVLTRYCHLHTRPWVAPGQHVVAGQPIGVVGSTGHSSGPHLHFEVHAPDQGGGPAVPVDPQSWMREHGAPVTPRPLSRPRLVGGVQT